MNRRDLLKTLGFGLIAGSSAMAAPVSDEMFSARIGCAPLKGTFRGSLLIEILFSQTHPDGAVRIDSGPLLPLNATHEQFSAAYPHLASFVRLDKRDDAFYVRVA